MPAPTDAWLRIADLSPARLDAFMSVVKGLGLTIPAISTARKNLIDPERGPEMVAYAHRVIDTAAGIGAATVHVEAERDRADQIAEAHWLEVIHATSGLPTVLVGHASFLQADLAGLGAWFRCVMVPRFPTRRQEDGWWRPLTGHAPKGFRAHAGGSRTDHTLSARWRCRLRGGSSAAAVVAAMLRPVSSGRRGHAGRVRPRRGKQGSLPAT